MYFLKGHMTLLYHKDKMHKVLLARRVRRCKNIYIDTGSWFFPECRCPHSCRRLGHTDCLVALLKLGRSCQLHNTSHSKSQHVPIWVLTYRTRYFSLDNKKFQEIFFGAGEHAIKAKMINFMVTIPARGIQQHKIPCVSHPPADIFWRCVFVRRQPT